MPWTLYRYILRELLKVLVLTTAVLVVVLSFGAAIGPLADGMLGPVTLVKFVLYTMPTVLGFALPFAGAFSATVVFHAMTKDNEVLACRAGGMSYSRIFAPVGMLGVVLMVVLLLLSNTIVPGFWKAAKKTVEGDVLGVLVSQLNQNRPYHFGDNGLVLYADAAEVRDPPAGSGIDTLKAEQFIVMTGVAVGQTDSQTSRIINDTTASTASALLVRDLNGKAYISLRLQDPVYYDAVSGEMQTVGRSGSFETDQPILLPDPISDEAVFFTYQDLRRLKRQPHEFDMVRQAQSDLSDAVARQQLTHMIVESLQAATGPGFITLKGGLENTYYRLSAPLVEVNDRGLVLTGGDALKVTIDKYDNAALRGDPIRRFEGDYAEVSVRTDRFDREPAVRITMRNVSVLGLNDSGAVNNKAEYAFPAMRYPGKVLGQDPATLTANELGEWSQRDTIRRAPAVQLARHNLRFRIIQLKYMIDAELYTRLATALATPLLLLLGTVLAVRLHDRLPLVVFFWSFILAILTIVMIHTGSSMAERVSVDDVVNGLGGDRVIGVAVLWGGNLILLFVIAKLYLRIARN
ncbi:MAG: LptF/LptG family permease [Phycisphaeraceae bacterium]